MLVDRDVPIHVYFLWLFPYRNFKAQECSSRVAHICDPRRKRDVVYVM